MITEYRNKDFIEILQIILYQHQWLLYNFVQFLACFYKIVKVRDSFSIFKYFQAANFLV